MGGDHKCPVCQATFTRPQHVARHMRSRMFHFLLLIPHSLTPPSQTPATVRTNVSIVETNSQEGSPPVTCPMYSPHLSLLATCSPATSTNVTPTKSLFPTSHPAVAEKVLLPLLVQPPPNRPVTNVSSPASHVTAPIPAVRPPPPFPITLSSFPLFRSKMRLPQVSLYICQISPTNRSERSWPSSTTLPLLFLLLPQQYHSLFATPTQSFQWFHPCPTSVRVASWLFPLSQFRPDLQYPVYL